MKTRGKVTVSVRQGPRDCQEDRYFISRIKKSGVKGWLLAVMDGHDGEEVAEICAQKIGSLFKFGGADEAEHALYSLAAELNTLTADMDAGSTLSLAAILESHQKVVVAVIGDSPVVVLDRRGNLCVSPEHNVRSNKNERLAVEKRGGVYDDGYVCKEYGGYGLQLSRALGDARFDGIISREPQIFSVSEPAWVLVASDGLFDPAHSSGTDILRRVEENAARHADAEDMMAWAEHNGLKDNATALVWRENRYTVFVRNLSHLYSWLVKKI